jgi:hypothetical protein
MSADDQCRPRKGREEAWYVPAFASWETLRNFEGRASPLCTHDFAEQLNGTPDDAMPEILAETLVLTVPMAVVCLAGRIKMQVIVRRARVFLDCASSKLTAAIQEYAVNSAASRVAISKNAKFWHCELELPTASNIRGAEKIFVQSEAQRAKHRRNQKITSCEVEKTQE